MKVYIFTVNFIIFGVFLQPVAAESRAEEEMLRSPLAWRSIGHRKWVGESVNKQNRFYIDIEEHEVK